MNPFVCKIHGQVEPYISTHMDDRGHMRTFRTCHICKLERNKKRYQEKKKEIAEFQRKWYIKNREHSLKVSAQSRLKLRDEVIKAYGSKCECCGDTNREFLTVDHINGGGNKLRKTTQKGGKLYRELRDKGFPKDGYRLLCFNCNWAYGHYGYCPHKRSIPL